MKSSAKTPPVLKQFVGFWTLQRQPSEKKEWTREEKFRQGKKAGFDAMGVGTEPDVVPLCKKYGMTAVSYINGNATYKEALKASKSVNPARVNVQLLDHDTPPAEAAKLWIKMESEARKLGLEIDLEVHRDTCTETPEKTYEIADLYKKATGEKIRLCFDFSHFAVVKHLSPPFAARLLDHPDLVQLSRQVHFRPFNGHHAQVPATDGKGNETPEFKDYLDFIDAFFACWFKGAKGGEVLYACPEFGPQGSGYGISTFPNVFKDAILLREKTEALWKANLRKWKK
jgi:sugar phosphate isomerase/epimerase